MVIIIALILINKNLNLAPNGQICVADEVHVDGQAGGRGGAWLSTLLKFFLLLSFQTKLIMSMAKQVDEEVQSWNGWKLDGLGGGRWFC